MFGIFRIGRWRAIRARHMIVFATPNSILAVWALAVVRAAIPAPSPMPSVVVVMVGDELLDSHNWRGICFFGTPRTIIINGQALGLSADEIPTGPAAALARATLHHEAAHAMQPWPTRPHGKEFRRSARRIARLLGLPPPAGDHRCKQWPTSDGVAIFTHRPARPRARKPAPPKPTPRRTTAKNAQICAFAPWLAGVVLALAKTLPRYEAGRRRAIARQAASVGLDPAPYLPLSRASATGAMLRDLSRSMASCA